MEPKLSKKLNEQLTLFLDHHPPRPFSAALRRMLLDYMCDKVKIGFDTEFGNLLWGLNDLLDLLDTAAKEEKITG
jgi:hypothetical protein